MNKTFAICGPIGVGKSTLLRSLKSEFKKKTGLSLSIAEECPNPVILKEYYNGMSGIAGLTPKDVCFKTQIHFLGLKLASCNKATKIGSSDQGWIGLDKCFQEDLIFAKMQFDLGYFTKSQFDIYEKFYESYSEVYTPPNIWIILMNDPKTCYNNVQKRIKGKKLKGVSTSGEELITLEYLETLHKKYVDWILIMQSKYGKERVKVLNIKNGSFVDTLLVLEFIEKFKQPQLGQFPRKDVTAFRNVIENIASRGDKLRIKLDRIENLHFSILRLKEIEYADHYINMIKELKGLIVPEEMHFIKMIKELKGMRKKENDDHFIKMIKELKGMRKKEKDDHLIKMIKRLKEKSKKEKITSIVL